MAIRLVLLGPRYSYLAPFLQGAVKIDGEKVEDPKREIASGGTHVYQVGKRRFARITIR